MPSEFKRGCEAGGLAEANSPFCLAVLRFIVHRALGMSIYRFFGAAAVWLGDLLGFDKENELDDF